MRNTSHKDQSEQNDTSSLTLHQKNNTAKKTDKYFALFDKSGLTILAYNTPTQKQNEKKKHKKSLFHSKRNKQK